jgi:hypothetical protein
MIKKLAIVTFLLVLSAFILVGRAWAQTSVPGVSKGNVFYYDFRVFWSSTNQNATVPPESLIELNQTQWLRIEVTDVYVSMVYLNVTFHYENGTEENLPGYVNIDTGESANGNGLIIAPNLNANDVVYPQGNSSFTINETVTRTYPFGVRETDHFSANIANSAQFSSDSENIYYDRQTGALLEWYTVQSPSSDPSQTISLQWVIRESNVLAVPTSPSPSPTPTEPGKVTSAPDTYFYVLAAVAIVIVIVAASLMLRKRARDRKEMQFLDDSYGNL